MRNLFTRNNRYAESIPSISSYKNYNSSTPNFGEKYNPGFYSPKTKDASVFGGITVKTTSGEDFLLSDLWMQKPVVLKIMARLGCAVCKLEARELSDLKPYLDLKGVTLAAVAFEDIDLKTFLSAGYWEWQILLDPEQKAYKAAKLHRMTWASYFKDVFTKRVIQIYALLMGKGISNNMKGDPRVLGGTFVIDTNGQIIYEFRPSYLAMSPEIEEIYAAIGGDPTELDYSYFINNQYRYSKRESELIAEKKLSFSERNSLRSFSS